MRYSAIATVLMLATLMLSITACAKQELAELVDNRHKTFTHHAQNEGNADKTAYKYNPDSVEYGENAKVETVQTEELKPLPSNELSALPPQQDPSNGVEDAFPTSVNNQATVNTQITDSVTQTNVQDANISQPPAAVNPQVTDIATSIVNKTAAFQWPVQGNITRQYGTLYNGHPEEGVVIKAARGTPIQAAASGEVAYVGAALPEYGQMVIIRHNNGFMSSYAHAQEILVGKGQFVGKGETIGYVGNSGFASEPQLHFTIRQGEQTVNPVSYLP